MFKIKKAELANIPQIIALLCEFAEYENLLDYVEITEERLEIALFGEGKTAEAILAFDGETPIGYAVFYPSFSTFRGQRGFYLEDIYITKSHRKNGVGEMMLRFIANLAKSRGFERIDFLVLEWNSPAVEFYKKLGAVRDEEERHFKFTDEAFQKLAKN
ncbi:MAG TPA: GNAT family N-acetyltransferase [Pyrinomonadaceae bacterium]|nr:GNAT family N-acetyltransferase [Pyrinomonadaceae bacterium]